MANIPLKQQEPLTGRWQGESGVVNAADLLQNILTSLTTAKETSIDSGIATGGSNTTLVDTTKSWQTNVWENALMEVKHGGVGYVVQIQSNTSNTITFVSDIGVAVAVGDSYDIKIPVQQIYVPGMATGAKQDTGNTSLASILSALQGTINTNINASAVTSTTHHNAEPTTGTGTDATVSGLKNLKLALTGANVLTSTISFWASVDGTNFNPIVGCKEGDTSFTLATSTTTVQGATPEVWDFDVTGYTKFRVSIDALTGTNAAITSKSRALA